MLRVVVAPLPRCQGSVESRCTHDVPIKRISKPYGPHFYTHAVSQLLCSSAVRFEAYKAWHAMPQSSRRTGAVFASNGEGDCGDDIDNFIITVCIRPGAPFSRLLLSPSTVLCVAAAFAGAAVSRLFPVPSLSAHLEKPSGTLLKTPGSW